MNIMKISCLALSLLLAACSIPAFGQFGGWKNQIPHPTRSGVDALARSGDFVSYLTIATDQGMKALNELAAAFPPEKVAAFQKLSAQYQEAAKNRPNGNIDAESFTVASDAADEMAKLEKDWQTYRKEGAQGVRKAHARIGLMLIADGEGSTRAPQLLRDLQGQARSISIKTYDSDKANRIRNMITFLECVVDQAPRQTTSFTTVRRIAKNIADAEHYQLAQDPPADSVTTTAQMNLAVTKIDADNMGGN